MKQIKSTHSRSEQAKLIWNKKANGFLYFHMVNSVTYTFKYQQKMLTSPVNCIQSRSMVKGIGKNDNFYVTLLQTNKLNQCEGLIQDKSGNNIVNEFERENSEWLDMHFQQAPGENMIIKGATNKGRNRKKVIHIR